MHPSDQGHVLLAETFENILVHQLSCAARSLVSDAAFSSSEGAGPALLRGTHELVLGTPTAPATPGYSYITVTVQPPTAAAFTVEAFADADGVFRARVMCFETGTWTWTASEPGVTPSGSFSVVASDLPGKLATSGYQFNTARGWFLHIGDTAYRWFQMDTLWQEYLTDNNQIGITKLRAYYANDLDVLVSPAGGAIIWSYMNRVDERLRWALQNYPHIMIELLVFGNEGRVLSSYADSGGFID